MPGKSNARTLARAAAEHHAVTVRYNAPKRGGVVTRHVRPYEVSTNKAGRPVLWGTDSIHGPRQIHSFRLDRVVEVKEVKRPTAFKPAKSVTKHLRSFKREPAA